MSTIARFVIVEDNPKIKKKRIVGIIEIGIVDKVVDVIVVTPDERQQSIEYTEGSECCYASAVQRLLLTFIRRHPFMSIVFTAVCQLF